MTATTIITLLIGIFGANITLISALRSQHHDFVKRCYEDCERKVNELLTLLSSNATCSASKDARKAGREIPRLYSWYWVKALAIPTWVFAAYVVVVTTVFVVMPWPQTISDTTSEITSFITSHSAAIKFFVGAFLILNLGCFFTALYSQKRIRTLFEGMELHIETAKEAVKASKQNSVASQSAAGRQT